MTAMFRTVGACFADFDDASKISGLLMLASAMYSGYMLPKPSMHPWFVWIYWINPLSYAFEALLSNEFHEKLIPCVENNLVPNGPGYTDLTYQSCAGVRGALPGEVSLTGDNYLMSLSYSYDHLWRNFGIIWAWWALFLGVTIIATSFWSTESEKGHSLQIPREKVARTRTLHARADEEAQVQGGEASENQEVPGSPESSASTVEADTAGDSTGGGGGGLIRNRSVFTWKKLKYTVKTPSGDRVLLDDVHGWVKPGMLGALMGSSGAGKTTLLDVLAQRKTEGTIQGSILVDGQPLPVSFQRSAGYCEQLDVHEPLATVREALGFSALLRQPREVSRNEKLKYVDNIIDLLELHDIADTLIGKVGAGLSVEQRKRVTIGVELAAKPSILIFLDEPTSGLDGQSAFNTIRFLRKLADAGQAILVTIHQPSAQLFSQFDTLLLLAKGGKTVYFGDIGDDAQVLRGYFEKQGAPCPLDANPAEHMIDVVSGQLSRDKDWNQIWLESPEHAAMTKELERIIEEASSKPPATADDGHEFAMSLWEQTKIVTHRMNVALFRNTGYANNKFILHIITALFNGSSFWMIGNNIADLQLRLFTIFNFIFVAPGVIAQLQPLFIDRRDIYEAREKKSKMYSWIAFVTGLIVSELPYLCVCAVLYYVCWYYTVGFPANSSRAGSTLFVMLMYEFLYTGIGQFIAAYAPNAVFATLINPLIIGILVAFCGVLVPYTQIQTFWRYWIYYLNPFNYLMGSLLVFGVWDVDIECAEAELAVFDPPGGSTCGQYLNDYMQTFGARSTLVNPDDRYACRVCQFQSGSDYLATVNLNDYYYGWRDAAIVVIFVISS
jgi:ABC-type multidrug transport system permease subunit/ABC-type multidrug transport system ATPase subunit